MNEEIVKTLREIMIYIRTEAKPKSVSGMKDDNTLAQVNNEPRDESPQQTQNAIEVKKIDKPVMIVYAKNKNHEPIADLLYNLIKPVTSLEKFGDARVTVSTFANVNLVYTRRRFPIL
jgi:hypothetical protein